MGKKKDAAKAEAEKSVENALGSLIGGPKGKTSDSKKDEAKDSSEPVVTSTKLPVTVKVSLDDLLGLKKSELSEKLSVLATGSTLVQDLTYEVVGFEPKNVLLIEVRGETTLIEKD